MENEEDEDEDAIFGSSEEENFNVWADSLQGLESEQSH